MFNDQNKLQRAISDAKEQKDSATLTELRDRLKAAKSDVKTHLLLSDALMSVKRLEEAVEFLRPLVADGNIAAALKAAAASSQLKDPESTVAFIREALKAEQPAVNDVARCILFAARVREFEVSDDIFNRYSKTIPINPYFLMCKAHAEHLKGNNIAARIFARKAIDMDPDNVDLKLEAYREFMPFEDFFEFEYEGRNILMYTHEIIDLKKKKRKSKFEEIKMLEFIRDKLGDQKTVLDIGCHIGNHSRYIQEFVNHKMIIGFDAAPNASTFYCRNIRNAIFYNVCLGLEGEEIHLLGDILNNRWGQSRIADEHEKSRVDAKPMRTMAIDTFQFPDVSLMKIDVEGWELKVLEGSMRTIDTYKPDIILEVWKDNIDGYHDWFRENLPGYEVLKTLGDVTAKKHDVCLRYRDR